MSDLERKEKVTGIPSIDKLWRNYYSDEELNIQVPDMSLTDYIYEKNKNRLDLFAIHYLSKKISYEELFDNIDKTSRRFQKYGVKENDYVALALPMTPEAIYMMYGLDNIGANANLIDPRVPADRMNYYLNIVTSRLAAITGAHVATMRSAVKKSDVSTVISISPLSFLDKQEQKDFLFREYSKKDIQILMLKKFREELLNNIYNAKSKVLGGSEIIDYSKFESGGLRELVKVPYKSGKTSVIEYTSGTTGTPKALGLTSRGMNVTAEQLSIINRAEAGESVLAIMPPFISYGAVTGIHNSLGCGFEMILVPNFSVEIFAGLIKKYHPNNIICVPSMFKHVIDSFELQNEDVSYIKRLIFGGDKTLPEFEKEVNAWLSSHGANITLIKGGGMAEYSSCAFETPFDETKKLGIYGIPLPLVDAKIMKDDNTECGYNEIGEIYISSPQEMKGYINDKEATDNFFFVDDNGKKWGRSGDLGYVNLDGTFVLTSRKKQMIVRPDGHNVFPNEIEEVIMNTGYVKSCVVIGVKDESSVIGEYPFAFIELKEEYVNASDNILQRIKQIVNKSIPVRDRPKDSDYILMTMIYSKEGKLDRSEMIKVLKK